MKNSKLKRKYSSIQFCILHFALLFTACSPNNVTEDDSLGKFFEEKNVKGTFGMFDNGQGQFTVYDLSRYKDSAYLPASTFKIVNGLIALKTGRVSDEKMVIKWDGVQRWNPNWNKDLSFEEAFKVSSFPYFQEVARRIGKDTMQQWLDTLGYGNKKISVIDSFWVDNSLKITADEQLGLVKKIYFEQLPIDKRSQRIIRQVMMQENNANYQLSYKTGLGFRENGNAIGWVVGWIEENRHPYFFAMNLEGPHDLDPKVRSEILKNILTKLGFFEGRK